MRMLVSCAILESMKTSQKTVNVKGLSEGLIRALEVLVAQLRHTAKSVNGKPASTGETTGAKFVEEAQRRTRRYITARGSIVDSFIQERRREAKRESHGN
jgi:hypothetical protein